MNTSLIKVHEVFTSLILIKLHQVFTSLIKVHEVLGPEHAMVLSVFLACMFLDNDNLIKI